jgi:hypothetical protein
MAKSRITKRGKIRSMVKAFRPDGRLTWRKQKTLAMLANKKQWIGEYGIEYTPDTEIASGEGFGIIIESSSVSLPTYIVIE